MNSRGIFRTLSNVYDGDLLFAENQSRNSSRKYFMLLDNSVYISPNEIFESFIFFIFFIFFWVFLFFAVPIDIFKKASKSVFFKIVVWKDDLV